MAFTFKTPIETIFTSTWLPSVGGGVAVVNGSNTTQGIVKYDSAITMGSELDVVMSGTVRVIADNIGTVDEDGVITVDGKRVFVTGVQLDAAGAITVITFTESRPIPEEMF